MGAPTELLAVIAPSGRPLMLSDGCRQLCGLDASSPLPEHLAELYADWAAAQLRDVVLPIAERTGLWQGATALLGPSGGEIPASQVVLASRDLDDEVACFHIVLGDAHAQLPPDAPSGSAGVATIIPTADAGLQLHARLLDAVGEAVVVTDPGGVIIYWNAAAQRLYGWRASEVVGAHILSVRWMIDQRDTATEILATLRGGASWTGELEVRRKGGERVRVRLTETPVLDADARLAAIIGVATDITELRAVSDREQRRADQQAAVAAIGHEALETDGLDRVLQRACELIAEALEVELSKVLELEPGGEQLRLRAGVGWRAGLVGSATVPTEKDSQAGYTLLQLAPVVVPDVRRETRFAPPDLLVEHDVASGMSVIIRVHGRPFGVLGVHTKRPRTFDADDVAFLQTVADLLSATVERHDTHAELQRMALQDPLTGLANRTLFLDHLRTALAQARGRQETVGVLFLDLDRFKLVNDALGHVAGDELLRTVAGRLLRAVREGDVVARLGGDEFAVLCQGLPGAGRSVEVCVALAQRLRGAVAPVVTVSGVETYVTASVGIALNHRAEDADSLLRDADTAMYRAKHERQHPIEVFDDELRERAFRRLGLVNALRRAEEEGQFRLHYQPEIDLRTGELFGFEALLRWEHPEQGLLNPEHFIDLAEETGLVIPVGAWVLQQACAQSARWAAQTSCGRPPPVAVNVSRRQLVRDDLVDVVRRALTDAALPADRLFLEITESAVIDDPPAATSVLAELSTLGVRVAIDDFGTGYSSLENLRTFAVDVLKVDRGFVGGLGEERESDRKIIQATVGLAHALDVCTVAEGVETEGQEQQLRMLGCEVGQGYRWCRPQAPQAIERWFDTHPGARRLSEISAR